MEIEPQTLWIKATGPGAAPRGSRTQLDELATLPQRKLLHGIGYPIGGTICDHDVHVGEFRRWSERLDAPWTSEHLSILDVEGAQGPRSCGFLMPPVQTDETAALAAANIRRRRMVTGRPFAFETGVNYFEPRPGEMPDGAFFASVAEAADCGILLDLNNLWVNARNGRSSIDRVLAELPLERVWEVHLAGAEFAHGFWLDAHCGPIDPDLAAIAAEVTANLPNLGAIVFEVAADRLPGFPEAAFLRQMETLHRLWEGVRPDQPVQSPPIVRNPASERSPSHAAWERRISAIMLSGADRPAGIEDLQPPAAADERSFDLYRRLVASFRRGAIADVLENSIRLLLIAVGEEALTVLLDDYFAATSPTLFPSDEALAFKRFIEPRADLAPGFADVLRFEAALIEAIVDERTIRVALTRDIDGLLADIGDRRLPQPCADAPTQVWEIGANPSPFVRRLDSGRAQPGVALAGS